MLGVLTCLRVYRSQAFAGQGEFSKKCALQHDLLAEFARAHTEAACIQGLITDTPGKLSAH